VVLDNAFFVDLRLASNNLKVKKDILDEYQMIGHLPTGIQQELEFLKRERLHIKFKFFRFFSIELINDIYENL
jgi:hypothetical protein